VDERGVRVRRVRCAPAVPFGRAARADGDGAGDKTLPPAPPRLSEMFDKDTLDAQVVSATSLLIIVPTLIGLSQAALQTEVEALEARRVRPAADGDTYMQSIELTT
jgi:hypothetical protein